VREREGEESQVTHERVFQPQGKGKGAGIEEIMPPRHVELEIVIWHSEPGIWHWQGHLHRPGCCPKKRGKKRGIKRGVVTAVYSSVNCFWSSRNFVSCYL